jgi:hypothetical protein
MAILLWTSHSVINFCCFIGVRLAYLLVLAASCELKSGCSFYPPTRRAVRLLARKDVIKSNFQCHFSRYSRLKSALDVELRRLAGRRRHGSKLTSLVNSPSMVYRQHSIHTFRLCLTVFELFTKNRFHCYRGIPSGKNSFSEKADPQLSISDLPTFLVYLKPFYELFAILLSSITGFA